VDASFTAAATRRAKARAKAAAAPVPMRFGDGHFVQHIDATHARLWPNGSVPARDQKFRPRLSDTLTEEEPFLPPELVISWILECSPEFRLATYQEIRADGGCRARLRYTRTDASGVIVADVMLSRLPEVVR
jgi:hypothetical protein